MKIGAFEKIIERINSEWVISTEQVKQSVIVPILRGLGWDDTNPDECLSAYPTPPQVEGRIDYTLWQVPGHPLVFIAAKEPGDADENDEYQLFRYAHTQSVPLLIVTDGDVWNFYLSTAGGILSERRFYRAVLTTKKNSVEYLHNFERYLGKTQVRSGESLATAKKVHIRVRAKEKAKGSILKVWQTLLEKPDPQLRDMLAVAVENECGTKPESDDLDDFLANQLNPVHSFHPPAAPPADKTFAVKTSQIKRPAKQVKKIIGYEFNGREKMTGASIRTLAEILKELGRGNPGFMHRFASATETKTRRLVAQRREYLYDNQKFIDRSIDLDSGWWLGTNYSTESIRNHIQIACKIADVNVTLIEE